MAIMLILGAAGALILSIVGYFVFKKVIEDLSIYIAIICVVGTIILAFLAIKKWKIFEKLKKWYQDENPLSPFHNC